MAHNSRSLAKQTMVLTMSLTFLSQRLMARNCLKGLERHWRLRKMQMFLCSLFENQQETNRETLSQETSREFSPASSTYPISHEQGFPPRSNSRDVQIDLNQVRLLYEQANSEESQRCRGALPHPPASSREPSMRFGRMVKTQMAYFKTGWLHSVKG